MDRLAAHRMALDVLDEHRRSRCRRRREIEDAPEWASVLRRMRASTAKCERLAAAAVDDAGDVALRGAGGARSASPRGAGGQGERVESSHGEVVAAGTGAMSGAAMLAKVRLRRPLGGVAFESMSPDDGADASSSACCTSSALALGGVLFVMFLRSDDASHGREPPDEDDGGGGGNDRIPAPAQDLAVRRHPAARRRASPTCACARPRAPRRPAAAAACAARQPRRARRRARRPRYRAR